MCRCRQWKLMKKNSSIVLYFKYFLIRIGPIKNCIFLGWRYTVDWPCFNHNRVQCWFQKHLHVMFSQWYSRKIINIVPPPLLGRGVRIFNSRVKTQSNHMTTARFFPYAQWKINVKTVPFRTLSTFYDRAQTSDCKQLHTNQYNQTRLLRNPR